MQKLVKQLRNGQITIPKQFREKLGLRDDDLLSVSIVGDKIEIEPVRVSARAGRPDWARELYELYAPVRKKLESKSEDEINAAIVAREGRPRYCRIRTRPDQPARCLRPPLGRATEQVHNGPISSDHSRDHGCHSSIES